MATTFAPARAAMALKWPVLSLAFRSVETSIPNKHNAYKLADEHWQRKRTAAVHGCAGIEFGHSAGSKLGG
jgi:hypothetical protein